MNVRAVKGWMLALTLVLCGLVAGCGGEQAKNEKQDGGPVTVDFWYAINGHNAEGVEKLVKEFNETHPQIVVKAQQQGDYYSNATKLQAALVAGNQPDVTMLEVSQVGQFGLSGALADLTPYYSKEEVGRFHSGLMKDSYLNDKLIAIPFNRSTPLLYINRTMVEQAGLDPAGPKNWDELHTYAAKLTKKDQGVYGLEVPIDIWFYEAGVFQQSGTILSADGKNAAFNNEAGYGIARLWKTMIEEGVMKNPPGQDYNAWDVASNDFINQKVAMIEVSTASLGGFLKAVDGKFSIGTAFLPAGKQFATPTGGANLVVLEKSSQAKKKAAAEFIQWMTNQKNAAFFSEWSGYIPVTTDAVDSEQIRQLYAKYPQYKIALDQLQYAQAKPMVKGYREISVKIQEALKKAMIDPSVTVEQAVSEAAQQVQGILGQ